MEHIRFLLVCLVSLQLQAQALAHADELWTCRSSASRSSQASRVTNVPSATPEEVCEPFTARAGGFNKISPEAFALLSPARQMLENLETLKPDPMIVARERGDKKLSSPPSLSMTPEHETRPERKKTSRRQRHKKSLSPALGKRTADRG